MAADRAGGAMRAVDIVVTTLLAIVACLVGLLYGYVALVATPTSAAAIWWVVIAVLMMVVPVAATIVGIQRIRAGRVGFWMPLAGGVAVAGLLGGLALLWNTL